MSEHDQDVPPPGPALAPDGTLTGRTAPAPSLEPTPASEEAPLELQERPRAVKELPPETFRDPAPRPGNRTGVAVAGVALVAGFLAAWTLVERRGADGTGPAAVRASSDLEGLLAPRRLPVVVDSEPAGAVVQIGPDVVGVTPWAGDNRWGEQEIQLRLQGYQPWKGRLRKDAETRFSVTLQRR